MALDPTTDAIAHFAGFFALAVESGRDRPDYDPFAGERPEEDPDRPLDLSTAASDGAHDLRGVDPRLDYAASHHAFTYSGAQFATAPLRGGADPLTFAMAAPRSGLDGPVSAPAGGRAEVLILPPSALVSVTVQRNVLTDDDILGDITGAGFTPVAPLTEALSALAAVAGSLGPVTLDLSGGVAGWGDMALATLATLPPAGRVADGSLRIDTLRGPDAAGIRVDGAWAEEMPDWSAFRPDHLDGRDLPLREPAAADEDASGVPDGATPDPFAGLPGDGPDGPDGPGASAAGQQIVAGANVAVNHVSLVSNWLDAPVIAVAGRVVSLDAISQVNVLADRDSAPGLPSPASAAVNAAEIARTPGTAPEGGGDGPADWAVVRIEGDLTQINWIDQYNFVTDHDRAGITLSGRETRIELGGNELVNAATFWELGFTYDLIVVGGDMIDLSVIEQTNVLLDTDSVDTGPAGASPAAAGPAGTATDGASAAGRDMAGLSGRGRDDGPAERPGGDDASPAEGGRAPDASPAGTSTGDNLLWNEARIETVGADVHAELDSAFAETIDRLAEGARDIAAATAGHDLFEGLDLLRVLYVSGDFVTVDRVSQTNVLGDADQVRTARDAFVEDLHDEVAVITGSNLLANVAEIVDDGVDSTVMAGGESYSDALIHQAGFLDEGAANGAGIADLASEAIAFLVDGMIGTPDAAGIDPVDGAIDSVMPGQSDVMQTVLA